MSWGKKAAGFKAGQKYGAVKTHCGAGHKHDSKAEAVRCDQLRLAERAGVISDLRYQVAYPLVPGGVPILLRSASRPNGVCAKITFDHVYCEGGIEVADDSKGMPGPDFALRLAVFQASYPHIRTRLNGVDTPGRTVTNIGGTNG